MTGKWKMALECYALAPMGREAFSSLLYDSGRSNSGPAGWAFPHLLSGEDMSQEGAGYVENTRTLFHEDRRSNRGRSRRARLGLGMPGRSKIDPMNGHDCALPRFREGRFLFFGDRGGLWFREREFERPV